jgi:rubrerythrin
MTQLVLVRISTVVALLLMSASMGLGDDSGTVTQTNTKAGQTKEVKRDEALLYNLQTAYATELNEAVVYIAFSKKADEEGYGQVASLFRALAHAEGIHSANKAALIEELKGTLEYQWDSLDVQSTIANLDWALAAENYEKETMYPRYALQADKANNNEVMQAYEFHLASEQKHVQILSQARNDLAGYTGQNIDFFVCPMCGNTVRSLSFKVCPVCETPKEDFIKVR